MTPERIKAIRKAAGLSTSGFARILNVSDSRTLRRYETGARSISGPIATIAEMLDRGELPQWVIDRADADGRQR